MVALITMGYIKVIYYYRKNVFYCALLGSDTYESLNTCFRRGHCREKQLQKYSGIKSAQLRPTMYFLGGRGQGGTMLKLLKKRASPLVAEGKHILFQQLRQPGYNFGEQENKSYAHNLAGNKLEHAAVNVSQLPFRDTAFNKIA